MRPRGMGHHRGRGGMGGNFRGPRPQFTNQPRHVFQKKEPFVEEKKPPVLSQPEPKKRKIVKPHVIPKSATQCMSELCPTLKLTVTEPEGDGPYMVITELDNGQQYKGFGSTLDMAKESSAESALISYVAAPHNNPEQDQTPWHLLTSFSVYRLLREWKEVDNRTYNHKEIEALQNQPLTPTESKPKPLSERLTFPGDKVSFNTDRNSTTIIESSETLKLLKKSVPELRDSSFVLKTIKEENKPDRFLCTLAVRGRTFTVEGMDTTSSRNAAAEVAIAAFAKS